MDHGFSPRAKRLRGGLTLIVLLLGVMGRCLSQSQSQSDFLCQLPDQTRGFAPPANQTAKEALKEIGKVIPAQTDNIDVFPSENSIVVKDFGGAAAKICGVNPAQRYIFFNPRYIDSIGFSSGKPNWSQSFALAHEAAHHINGDTLRGNAWNSKQELDADYSAAVWLTRLGVSRDELLRAFDALPIPVASSNGYPTREERRAKVIQGYIYGAHTPVPHATSLASVINGFPSVVLECECDQCEHGGGGAIWVFEGRRGQAMWRYGAVADLTLEKFDGRNFTIQRVDPDGTYSSKYAPKGQLFKATYTGSIDGGHITGNVFGCKWDGDSPDIACRSSAACPLTSDQVLELGKNASRAGLKAAARECFRMAASMGNPLAKAFVDEIPSDAAP